MARRKKRIPTPPFRSNYEEDVSKVLTEQGVKWSYETYSYEYVEPLRRNRASCIECGSTNLERTGWYTPDFFIEGGRIIECKGRFTAADRRKILANCATVPELKEKLVMMFMRDNKLSKLAKQTYSMWCEANDIDYIVGTEPKEEWYNG